MHTHPRASRKPSASPRTSRRRSIAAGGLVAGTLVAFASAIAVALVPSTGHDAAAQDEPPSATLAFDAAAWPGRLGTHIWAGRAVDYRGIMTARVPFTATATATATLSIEGVGDLPVDLALTWHDVTGRDPDDAGDDWAAWRPEAAGTPVADVEPGLGPIALALPAEPGRYVLHAIGWWEGQSRGDVSWGWLVDVAEGGEVTFEGVFAGGFEASDFAAGPGACPAFGQPGTWWLSAEAETDFFERYRDLMEAETGSPFVQGFPVEVAFRGRLSPPGQYGHLGAYEREVTVTSLTAMTTTLRCGMDKPDLAVLEPTFVRGCDGPELGFVLANLGSRRIEAPIAVEVRDAEGGLVERIDDLGPLGPSQRAPIHWLWEPPLPATEPHELVASAPDLDERFAQNNRALVEHLPPPPCLPPTAEPEGGRAFVPRAERP